MGEQGRYRVGMVSKLTGLSTHTLRMWEKRYGTVVPERTEAGGRLYSDADVERLRLLQALVQAGNSIGGIANLPDLDLRRMVASFPTTSEASGPQALADVRERVMSAIERLQVTEAEHILSRAALGTEPVEFLKGVVGPVLTEVGDRWERRELRIAHEHACSAVTRGLLFSLMRLYPSNNAERTAVVATPAHEDHELGAMMVSMLAAMHGWNVLYLGPNLPAEEIGFAVRDTNAELLLVSVTNLEGDAAAHELHAIEQAVPSNVSIVAGGQAANVGQDSRIEIQQDLEVLSQTLSR